MPEVDLGSVLSGGTEDDQKKFGTSKESHTRLRLQFKELLENGGSDPEIYQSSLLMLVNSFETIRLEQERQIKDYENKIAYCRAKQKACSEHTALVLGIIGTKLQELKQSHGVVTSAVLAAPSGIERLRDVDVLGNTMCMCGCQDEEDAKDCSCACHVDGYCSVDDCSFCQAKKAQIQAETGRRRRAPAKKKARKKAKPKEE